MHISAIPKYKRIHTTTYTVDCFSYGVEGCTHHFLSHFHADHYTKLNRSFEKVVYCSETTSNLVKAIIKCNTYVLPLDQDVNLSPTDTVRCIEAFHCPGAVCFIFKIKDIFFLHTGDFRAADDFYKGLCFEPMLHFNAIYFDNTYENFRNFSSQRDAIFSILHYIDNLKSVNTLVPLKYKFMFCTYLVGKEKIFFSIAEYLDVRIEVNKRKMDIYNCFCDYTRNRLNKEVKAIVEEYRRLENGKKNNYAGGRKRRCSFDENTNASVLRQRKVKSNKLLALLKNNSSLIEDFGFIQRPEHEILQTPLSMESSLTQETQKLESDDALFNNNIIANIPIVTDIPSHSTSIFDRLTQNESTGGVKVISTVHSNKKHFQKIAKNVEADKIIMFYGTGWKNGVCKYDWIRRGCKIKAGIEIVYVPYSEHSSSDEIKKFKEAMKYDTIINTVNNKWP